MENDSPSSRCRSKSQLRHLFPRRVTVSLPSLSRASALGQRYRKHSTHALFALHADAAAVLRNDFFGNG